MIDSERKEFTLARVEAARKSGNQIELGRALTALSWLARDIGLHDDEPPVVSAAKAGTEAVAVLRATNDLTALSEALRASAVPFVSGIDCLALLTEALRVARAAGDREQEAWSLAALGRAKLIDLDPVREAGEIFAEIGCVEGEAHTLRTLGVFDKVPRPQKAALLERSANLFLRAGKREEAYRSFFMAETFGTPKIPFAERRRLLHRALEATDEPRSKALTYRVLARVAEEAGNHEAAAAYRAEEDALDVAAYGSRAARLRSDIEALGECLEVGSARERKKMRAEIAALRAELDSLEGG